MIELFLAFFAGIIIGIITGLIPGLHINLVGSIILSYPVLSFADGLSIAVFVSSLSITHTFLDLIPGVFLGTPNDDSGLSVLPGHRLLLVGRGFDAIVHAMRGGLIGLIALVLLLPVIILVMPKIYNYLLNVVWIILILASLYLILSQSSKVLALFIFLLSGFLGAGTLGLSVNQSLLPLLSGLFGASTIIGSLLDRSAIPKQIASHINAWKLGFKESLSTFKTIIISSPIPAFMPGMGSSQAVIIGSSMIDDHKNPKGFLSLIGGTNVLVMGLSFLAVFLIGKARTGSAAVILEVLKNITAYQLTIVLISVIIAGIISFAIGIFIAKRLSKIIGSINYSYLSIAILLIITAFVIIFSGFVGLLVFITSACLGLLCMSLDIRRTTLMGALILPTIWLYWPF